VLVLPAVANLVPAMVDEDRSVVSRKLWHFCEQDRVGF